MFKMEQSDCPKSALSENLDKIKEKKELKILPSFLRDGRDEVDGVDRWCRLMVYCRSTAKRTCSVPVLIELAAVRTEVVGNLLCSSDKALDVVARPWTILQFLLYFQWQILRFFYLFVLLVFPTFFRHFEKEVCNC